MDPRVPLDGTLLAIPVPLPQAGPTAFAPGADPSPRTLPHAASLGIPAQ